MATNAYEIARSVLGQSIDMDGAYGAQCYDLANYVASKFGITFSGANAKDIATDNPHASSVADIFPFDPNNLQIGDMVTTTEDTQWGHVVFYGGGGANNALVVDQNWNYVQQVQEHRMDLVAHGANYIVRFRGQDNYKPSGNSGGPTSNNSKQMTTPALKLSALCTWHSA